MYDASPGSEARDRDHATSAAPTAALWWRKLLYRWFVEYNPTYLLSAALVLLGMILASRGIEEEWTLAGQLGVAAVAEAYAWALIAGSALLMRLRLPRPAVILGLLAVLYQGDLTLHTETSAFLVRHGEIASMAWVACFVGKLYAIAWALKLRLSRSATLVPVGAAIGMALMPHLLRDATSHDRALMVASWVFLLFGVGLWTRRSVSSPGLLGPAGLRARRALRASWVIWGVLAMVHVLFWAGKFQMVGGAVVLLPVAMLLSTRWIRREAGVWCAVGFTLLFAWAAMPGFLPMIAAMSAVTLTLHALRKPRVVTLAADPPSQDPYRTPASTSAVPPAIETETVFGLAGRQELARMLTGAMFAIHLALWTWDARWPDHMIALDLLVTVAVVLMVWKLRVWSAILPLSGLWLHSAVQSGIVSAPVTLLQWGVSLVGGGFALLALSLAASLHLRRRHDPIG